MRISDWSSDVCSSDLPARLGNALAPAATVFAAPVTGTNQQQIVATRTVAQRIQRLRAFAPGLAGRQTQIEQPTRRKQARSAEFVGQRIPVESLVDVINDALGEPIGTRPGADRIGCFLRQQGFRAGHQIDRQIGKANVSTATNATLVCRLLLDKIKKTTK